MRKFINPIELLNLQSLSIEEIDFSVLKKAKKIILAEMGLSENGFYRFGSLELNRSDIDKIFLQLEDKRNLELYYEIYLDEELNSFLSTGNTDILINHDPIEYSFEADLIDLISPYFADQYNNALLIALKNRNVDRFKTIIEFSPLVRGTDIDLAYKGVTDYYKDKIRQADLKTNQIKDNPSSFNKAHTQFLTQWVKAEFNTEILNNLPEYFQGLRNQIAKSLRNLSVNIYNKLNDSNVSYDIIDYVFDIETDSMTRQNIEDDYNTMYRIKERNKYSHITDKYIPVIEFFSNIFENLENNVAAPRYITKWINDNIDIDEINRIDYESETKDTIAYIIRNCAIACWNKHDDLETAIFLINKALTIKCRNEVLTKLISDKADLNRISFQQKQRGKPITSAPSLSTINGIGTKIYSDTLYFVFAFIPIFPIARYSLEETSYNSYRFFGKLELHKWQKMWNLGLGIFILFLLMFGLANSSDINRDVSSLNATQEYSYNDNSNSSNSNYTSINEEAAKYKGNYLHNGETPFEEIFGHGIFSSSSWIKITNNNMEDAVVCLYDINIGTVIRHAYIRSGYSLKMEKVPKGKYIIKAAFGRDWNPNEMIGNYRCGFFSNSYFFKQLYTDINPIKIENTSSHYTYGNIEIPSDLERYSDISSISKSAFFDIWQVYR